MKTEEQKQRRAQIMERARRLMRGRIAGRIGTVLRKQVNEVAREISRRENVTDMAHYAGQAVDARVTQIEELFISIYEDVGEYFGRRTLASLKSGGIEETLRKYETNTFKRIVRELLPMLGFRIAGINSTTKRKIDRIIRRGINDNMSVREIANEIERGVYLQQIINNRAIVISRTEVISASNFGSQAAAKMTGLELKKEWIATLINTRDEHKDAHAEKVQLDAPYRKTGEDLMYPGDPMGSPWNVINCNCTEVYDPD